MTDIYITRHGETQWNIEGRFQGRGNSELTARGEAQAKALGQVLDTEQIELILTSPLRRAQETARLARGSRDIPVLLLDSLSELDLGSWEGRHIKELAQREAENFHKFWFDPFAFDPAGGESFPELIARLEDAMEEVYSLAHGRKTLVITHGMALMAIQHVITGSDFNTIIREPVLKQTGITRIRATEVNDDIIYEVEYMNDTTHLPTELQPQVIPIKRSEE